MKKEKFKYKMFYNSQWKKMIDTGLKYSYISEIK